MSKAKTLAIYLTTLERKCSSLFDKYLDLDSRRKAIEVQQRANNKERNDVIKEIEKVKLELAYEKVIQGIELSSDPLVPSSLFTLEETDYLPRLIAYVLTKEDQNICRYTSICGTSNVDIGKERLSSIGKDIGFFRTKEELIQYKSSAFIQSLNKLEPTGLVPQE